MATARSTLLQPHHYKTVQKKDVVSLCACLGVVFVAINDTESSMAKWYYLLQASVEKTKIPTIITQGHYLSDSRANIAVTVLMVAASFEIIFIFAKGFERDKMRLLPFLSMFYFLLWEMGFSDPDSLPKTSIVRYKIKS